VVGGDAKCFSIAAASIIAKVTRDRLMEEYDRVYPGYGFARHKGYGTAAHMEAIRMRGPCPIHRTSFRLPKSQAGAV
jgi:ribonuclease HII